MDLPDDIKEEYPFKSHWIQQNDIRQHYLDEGRGQAVVMFHGNPTWSFYYRNVVKALSPSHRCLVLDHIGCGLSDKPQQYAYTLKQHITNAVRWIESLDIQAFDLIVHDWGGAIGMGLAETMPERIRKIVILNTAAFFLDRIPKRIALCRLPWIGPLIVRGLNGFARPALSMAVNKPLSSSAKKGYLFPYHDWASRVANLRFVQDIPTNPQQETYRVLQKIEAFLPKLADRPVLIGWGGRDFCFDDAFLERWKQYFPNARICVYPDAGHYVLEDARSLVIPEIKNFLAG